MPKFIISSEDPAPYKQQILDFWKDYLPGTPEGRFDWLLRNPAGSVLWYFAVDKDKKTLAGVISILPKNFYIEGKKIKAGIIGDFMLHRNYRVFGPALDLLKAALATVNQGVFDFVYSLPNPQSEKLATHVGLIPLTPLHYKVRPYRLNFIFEKCLGHTVSNLLDALLMPLLNCFSSDSYIGSGGFFEEVCWNDDSLDLFCQKIKQLKSTSLTGDCCLDYLEWRYHSNPERNFHISVYRSDKNREIQGYCAYVLQEDRLEIYEIVFTDQRVLLHTMKYIGKVATSNNCRGVYVLTNLDNKLSLRLKKSLYLDRGKHCDVYVYPEKREYYEFWNFLSSCRNS